VLTAVWSIENDVRVVRRSRVVAAVAAAFVVFSAGALAEPASLPFRARVLQPGELPAFKVVYRDTYETAERWAAASPSADKAISSWWAAKLRRDGFRRAFFQNMRSAAVDGGDAESWVAEFRSRDAASAELLVTLHASALIHAKTGTHSRAFAVNGIPGAHGFHNERPNSWGDNVLFADGRLIYLVGIGTRKAALDPPKRETLLAAATRLYKRVHGR
jgi:hypothetical protein